MKGRGPLLWIVLCTLVAHAGVSSFFLYRYFITSAPLGPSSKVTPPPPTDDDEGPADGPVGVCPLLLKATEQGPLLLRGNVVAKARLRLGFSVAGEVRTIRVKEGSRVRRGQLLATLDVAGADAQLRAAEVAVKKARRDATRTAGLVQRGAGTQVAQENAGTDLESAEASLGQATDLLQRTRLVAPTAGTIYQRLAEPGEAIGAGVPILLLDETGSPLVKVGVTEPELAHLRAGQRATLLPEAVPGPPQEAPLELKARIQSIAPSPDPSDGLYLVTLVPEHRMRQKLRPGALVGVRFPGGKDATLPVPLDALLHRQDQDFVFAIDRAGDHNRRGGDGERRDQGWVVRLRRVQTGSIADRSVRVLSGLHAGERIVAEGAAFLKDGQTVRLLDSCRDASHGP